MRSLFNEAWIFKYLSQSTNKNLNLLSGYKWLKCVTHVMKAAFSNVLNKESV